MFHWIRHYVVEVVCALPSALLVVLSFTRFLWFFGNENLGELASLGCMVQVRI